MNEIAQQTIDLPTPRRVAEFVIENEYELPPPRRVGLTATLQNMGVGESTLIPHERRNSLGPTIQHIQRSDSKRFTMRTMEHGIRVWRTT